MAELLIDQMKLAVVPLKQQTSYPDQAISTILMLSLVMLSLVMLSYVEFCYVEFCYVELDAQSLAVSKIPLTVMSIYRNPASDHENSTYSDQFLNPEEFTQVVEAILQGKYSWACVLILKAAGYNPLHYLPYRTYKRLLKDHRSGKRSTIETSAETSAETSIEISVEISVERNVQTNVEINRETRGETSVTASGVASLATEEILSSGIPKNLTYPCHLMEQTEPNPSRQLTQHLASSKLLVDLQ